MSFLRGDSCENDVDLPHEYGVNGDGVCDIPAIVELLATGFHKKLTDPPVGEFLAVCNRAHLV